MNHIPKLIRGTLLTLCIAIPLWGMSAETNEALEPVINAQNAETLIKGNTFEGWTVPSNHWTIKNGTIIGDTDSNTTC